MGIKTFFFLVYCISSVHKILNSFNSRSENHFIEYKSSDRGTWSDNVDED